MEIIITCPVDGFQAGLMYSVPDVKAKEYIKQEKAFEVNKPEPKQKKVKDGDG